MGLVMFSGRVYVIMEHRKHHLCWWICSGRICGTWYSLQTLTTSSAVSWIQALWNKSHQLDLIMSPFSLSLQTQFINCSTWKQDEEEKVRIIGSDVVNRTRLC